MSASAWRSSTSNRSLLPSAAATNIIKPRHRRCFVRLIIRTPRHGNHILRLARHSMASPWPRDSCLTMMFSAQIFAAANLAGPLLIE